ncbi:efflux RND transporter periplasmic adaptor subunit [Paucibacter sp. R3-3]|uniref:Efflux RND transporter periplasmic adaptor subunit n=1 Tax=Roseateles agri TaxID=3098619 RepID=A0ABU5DJY4_9BURK|nr:efflux RND transporter periplasmic adaptor subunit [Paucibacter sp. R3-3]MDY0746608.1 efflux RND transporter periplasmic adaptor subunit [Paucibacter sp. R3-3]
MLATAAPSSAAPRALACLIQPDKVADVGSPVIGVVEWIEVERGDSVRKGQVVARLRADVERANTDVARSRAVSEGDLRGALASLELAKIKRDRAVNLKAQDFVSQEAVDQAQSEMDIATERVKFSREQLATSSREFAASQAQVAQRVVRSPMDGVVIERHINAGERVEEKPMLRIADVSVLRVDVVAPVSMFGTLDIGQELIVQPELPGAGPRRARIVQIDKVLDPASNTFRLRLSLPNSHGLLPAGLRCSVELQPKPAAGASAAR